mmetsp:Transcript_6766/g.19782  ORF Transcript_6766/g.19782 Transcript_6766/m.19782 type:complete len:265 (-) Transcript_6766:159-953(-)
MKQSSLKDHLPKALGQRFDQLLPYQLGEGLVRRAALLVLLANLRQCLPVQVIHDEDSLGHHALHGPRRLQPGLVPPRPVRLLLKQVVYLVHGLGLLPEVQLVLHPLSDFGEDQVVVQRKQVLEGLGELDDVLHVTPELGLNVRPHHLDGDNLPALQGCLVHLGDRGAAEGNVLELRERRLDGLTVQELLGDDGLDDLRGQRVQPILQLAQPVDVLHREKIDPRGYELPALDVKPLELVHRPRKLRRAPLVQPVPKQILLALLVV